MTVRADRSSSSGTKHRMRETPRFEIARVGRRRRRRPTSPRFAPRGDSMDRRTLSSRGQRLPAAWTCPFRARSQALNRARLARTNRCFLFRKHESECLEAFEVTTKLGPVDDPCSSPLSRWTDMSHRSRLARCSTTPPGGAGSGERLEAEGIAALFLAPSADLEYLTGIERQIPSFGEPLVRARLGDRRVLPSRRGPGVRAAADVRRFDLREEPDGEVVVVNETDDGSRGLRAGRARRRGRAAVAVGDRVWAETMLNLGADPRADRLRTGSRLVNELRRVKTAEELEAMGRAIATVEHDDGRVGAARRARASRWPTSSRRSSTSCGSRARAARRSRPTSSPDSARTTSTPATATAPHGRSRREPR